MSMDKEMTHDPRMQQLMQSSLSIKMKEILRLCGYDLFVEMLQIVDHFSIDSEKGNVVRFPRPSIVERISRNDYIFTLHAEEGLSTEDIRSRLIKDLDTKLTPRHILRIISKLRSASN